MRRVKRGEAEQTIVDLTDNRKLIVLVSTSKARQIIYNPNDGTYNPDFSKEPMVLTPELYITGSSTNVIATAETVKWYVRPNTLGQRILIENNDTYSIGNDFKLTISKNIMKDMLTMEFILEVIYKEPDSDFRTTIPHHMELVNISMGEDGRDGIDGINGLDGERGLQGPKGADGESSYTHLAYANDATGTQDFSLSDSNRSYIGMYVDNLVNDSTNPSDYKWTKVEGMPGDKGIQGPKGVDGRTPYFHIAYATNDTGTEGFSVSDSVGKTYIGQYTDYIENDSTKPSDYSWTLIKGDKGEQGPRGLQGLQGEEGLQGPKGLDSYTHIAYATNETGTTGFSTSDPVDKVYIGMYVDNQPVDSTNPSDYKWTKARGDDGTDGAEGIPGKPGADGKTPYFHTAYADSEDGVTGFSTTVSKDKLYLGQYTDYIEADSSNPSLYSWTKIKGDTGSTGPRGLQGLQGDKGDTGIQGPKGTDGQDSYTHIAYANNDTGTSGFSVSDSANKLYIGMYVDSLPSDSTNPSDYNWTKIKGEEGPQGPQGIPGKVGADGRTPYLHIAYANNETGTTGFSLTDSTNKLYIGQYTDYVSTSSTNASLYTWTLIKGDKGDTGSVGPRGLQGIQGPQGSQGIQGPKGLDSYTHIAYSTSPTGATGFSTTDSTNRTYIGMYVDNTKSDSTNPSDYEWTLIKGEKGADGSQGIPGKAGADGRTPYLHIAYANIVQENILDTSNSVEGKGYLSSVSTDVSDYATATALLEPIPVTPGKDYRFVKSSNISDTDRYWRIAVADSNKGFLQRIVFLENDEKWTAGVNEYFIYVSYPTGTQPRIYEETAYSFSTTESSSRTHIGQYTDYIETDSEKPVDYDWTKIKGEIGNDGPKGDKGEVGAGGYTPYYHTAYIETRKGETDDPHFNNGLNGMVIYNNANDGSVVMSREVNVNSSQTVGTNRIKIYHVKAGGSPMRGGFVNGFSSVGTKAIYLVEFEAYIPKGAKLRMHNNSLGVGGRTYWITDDIGTGEFRLYAYIVEMGEGSESAGHISIDYPNTSFSWYISYYQRYNITNSFSTSSLPTATYIGSYVNMALEGVGRNYFVRKEENVDKLFSWAYGQESKEVGSLISEPIAVSIGDRFISNTTIDQVMFYTSSGTYLGALQGNGTGVNLSKVSGGRYDSFIVPDVSEIGIMRVSLRNNYMQGRALKDVDIDLQRGDTLYPYSVAPEELIIDSEDIKEYNWTRIKGGDGVDSATLTIMTPDGTTVRDTTSSVKLDSKLFIGGKEVTADSYKWYYSNGSSTITHSTGKTTAVSSTIVKSSLPIFLDATYNGTTYTSSVTINDISDVYTSIILGVSTFKNGKGTNTYTVKIYRNGEEIDTGGSQYSYEWEKLNSQGVKDTKFTKTGKTITINASEIDNTNLFNCYIYTK